MGYEEAVKLLDWGQSGHHLIGGWDERTARNAVLQSQLLVQLIHEIWCLRTDLYNWRLEVQQQQEQKQR